MAAECICCEDFVLDQIQDNSELSSDITVSNYSLFLHDGTQSDHLDTIVAILE